MQKKENKLIVIAGIDGCGKSTQIKMLANWLKRHNFSVTISKACDDKDKVILSPYLDKWKNDLAIMFLFQALHTQQYFKTLDSLNENKIVLADRWDETFLAYHENFGQLSKNKKMLYALNNLTFNNLLPSLGFVLVAPIEIIKQRRQIRKRGEKFENRSDNYFKTIQQSYIKIKPILIIFCSKVDYGI